MLPVVARLQALLEQMYPLVLRRIDQVLSQVLPGVGYRLLEVT